MLQIRTLQALGRIDLGSLQADPLLRWMAAIPLMVALAIRNLLPLVIAQLSELAGLDLGWLQAPLSGYTVVTLAPLIAGAVVGFLLLDQRDDRTLLALRVTPLPLGTYIAYRLAVPALAGLLVTLAAVAVAGGQGLGAGAFVAAVAAAPLAPLSALSLAAFARNKVEGLALMKAASVPLIAPLASLMLPPAWSYALAILPTYWIARATWALQAGEAAWPFLAGGWALSTGLIALLLLRLRRALSGD